MTQPFISSRTPSELSNSMFYQTEGPTFTAFFNWSGNRPLERKRRAFQQPGRSQI